MSQFMSMGDFALTDFTYKTGDIYAPKNADALAAIKGMQTQINRWHNAYPTTVMSVSVDGSVGPATVSATNTLAAYILKSYPSVGIQTGVGARWVAMHADAYAKFFQSIGDTKKLKPAGGSGGGLLDTLASNIKAVIDKAKPSAPPPADAAASAYVATMPTTASAGIAGISTNTLLIVGGGLAAYMLFFKKKGRK